MNVRFFALSLILGTVLLPIAVNAQGMGGGGMGRGENARGIINLNTSNTSLDGGLFSDLFQSGYVEYDGEYDCVVISVPVEDGVDQSRLVFFAPFGPNTNCPGTGKNLRQLAVAWPSGRGPFNLNGVDGAEAVERIDSRLGCDEVFPKDSPLGEDPPGETTTSCSLEVREYDE
jgi:hypothetical protein